MWKVNLGFSLALAVVVMSGIASYNSVQQFIIERRQAHAMQSDRLAMLWADLNQQRPPLTPDQTLGRVREFSNLEETYAQRQDEAVAARAEEASLIPLLACALALLITSLSLVLINYDVRARQETESQLAQAGAELEARVHERTADLARANEELRKARAELEVRVGQRTADLAHANEALRRTSTLQRAILDAANYSILSTDADGLIRTFNAAAQRWLGYAALEVVGRQTPLLFHDPQEIAKRQAELSDELGLPVEAGFEALVTGARYGASEEREWTYVRKHGGRFPVLLSVTALHDETGGVSGFLVIGSDITERRRAEEQLRHATEAAETANRAKSEFLANMSHELRTPLNSVIGFTNLLLKNKARNLREQDLTFLERVLDNGKHLLKLINEVLDLAKVEAGRMQVEPATVALDDLVRTTLAGLEAQVKGKPVRLVAELPPRIAPVDTDPGKLRQVLINLVGNAIKFTERGSVTVRVETDPGNGQPLALDVIDTGIGIPADKLETIFEAFQQGDASTARHFGGTGLGLTIARSLCRLLGYGIEVHSRVGYGSMFRIVLGEKGETTAQQLHRPLTSEIVIRAEQAGRLPDLKSKRVLVIDDESDSRMLLSQYLEDCGCQVLAVDQGARGLEAAEQFKPDLIILDLLMPVMDGLAFLDALRRDPRYVRLPVIVVTVKDLTPDETARLGADGSAIVRKGPELSRELERVVGDILRQRAGATLR